jgi:hypothetical protein
LLIQFHKVKLKINLPKCNTKRQTTNNKRFNATPNAKQQTTNALIQHQTPNNKRFEFPNWNEI